MKHLPSVILGAALSVCVLVSFADYLDRSRRLQRLESWSDRTHTNLLSLVEQVEHALERDSMVADGMKIDARIHSAMQNQIKELQREQEQL